MAEKGIPYFSFYPSNFMNGVRGLSPQEVGVYTMLLCRIYENDGPVEYNTLRLSTYCGMREKTFIAVAEKLISLGKITHENGMLSNARAEIEISNRADKLKNNSRAGKASGKKRQLNQCKTPTGVQQPLNHKDKNNTNKEKKEQKEIKCEEILSILMEVLDEQTAMELIQHRDEIKKPLTPLSAKKMVPELKKVSDPKAAIDAMIRNGWQGLNSAWIERQNGGRFTQPAPQPEPPKMREHDPKYDWPLGWPEEESLRYTWRIGSWFPRLGAKPNEPKCKIPRRFLDQWKAEGLDVYDPDDPPKEPEQEPFDFD